MSDGSFVKTQFFGRDLRVPLGCSKSALDDILHQATIIVRTAAKYNSDLESEGRRETDSLGKQQHEPGAKLDAGKQLPALVLGAFAPALKQVTEVGTFGANKYTPNGWLEVPNGKERYYEAMMRHILEDMIIKESVDSQTNIPHLAHAAWNILAILTLRTKG